MNYDLNFRLHFFRRLSTPSMNDCWEWQRGRDSCGYGMLKSPEGRTVRAHRVAYELAKGPIPEGLVVRHSCDNPPCANPAHLDVGTRWDNAQDAVKRNRYNRPRQQVCRNGHDQLVHGFGSRPGCKTCASATSHRRYLRRKEAQSAVR